MAGREPNFHKKNVVFWAKHLQIGPTKDIWGYLWAPLKFENVYPPLLLAQRCYIHLKWSYCATLHTVNSTNSVVKKKVRLRVFESSFIFEFDMLLDKKSILEEQYICQTRINGQKGPRGSLEPPSKSHQMSALRLCFPRPTHAVHIKFEEIERQDLNFWGRDGKMWNNQRGGGGGGGLEKVVEMETSSLRTMGILHRHQHHWCKKWWRAAGVGFNLISTPNPRGRERGGKNDENMWDCILRRRGCQSLLATQRCQPPILGLAANKIPVKSYEDEFHPWWIICLYCKKWHLDPDTGRRQKAPLTTFY